MVTPQLTVSGGTTESATRCWLYYPSFLALDSPPSGTSPPPYFTADWSCQIHSDEMPGENFGSCRQELLSVPVSGSELISLHNVKFSWDLI